MKVCVFGGGAIGGYLAGHLSQGECELSIVARGANLAAIKANGIRVITPRGEIAASVNVTDRPETLGQQDYLFITLKQQNLLDSIPQMSEIVGKSTCIIPPTTGIPPWYFREFDGKFRNVSLPLIDPGSLIANAFSQENIIGCVFFVPVEVREPGVVQCNAPNAHVRIGELDGSISDRLLWINNLMVGAGVLSTISRNIRGEIWSKMVNSLSWNPVAALTLATLGQIGGHPNTASIVKDMMYEADRIGRCLGVNIEESPEDRIATAIVAKNHKMSMLQDLENGRPLEFSQILSSFRQVQGLTGESTPIIDTVLALMDLRVKRSAR